MSYVYYITFTSNPQYFSLRLFEFYIVRNYIIGDTKLYANPEFPAPILHCVPTYILLRSKTQ